MVNDKKVYSLIEDLENTAIVLDKLEVSDDLKRDGSLSYIIDGLKELRCEISDFLDNYEHLR